MRCELHGLALGPTGVCVLCERETAKQTNHTALIVVSGVGLFLLLVVAAGAVLKNRAAPLPPPPTVDTPVAVAPVVPPGPIVAPTAVPTAAAPTLEGAKRDVAITIYSASWCGYCKKAKAYMDGHGIAYDDRDVDSDPANAKAMRTISPKGSIPAFQIDDETMVGWSEEGFEARVERAAKKRMRAP